MFHIYSEQNVVKFLVHNEKIQRKCLQLQHITFITNDGYNDQFLLFP